MRNHGGELGGSRRAPIGLAPRGYKRRTSRRRRTPTATVSTRPGLGFDRYAGLVGASDKAKDVTDNVKDATEENVDKLGGVIDKAADKIDEKTGGKHSDKIDQVVEPVQDPADATAGAEQPPS